MKVTFLRKKIDIAICTKNLIFSLVFNKPLSSNKLNNIKIAATRISAIRSSKKWEENEEIMKKIFSLILV